MENLEILFLRHGNAGPADRDFDKPLTDKGREQAMECRRDKLTYFNPNLVIVSPAARTVGTAAIVFDGVSAVVQAPELYLGMDDAERARQSGNFKKVGNAPLKTFVELDPEHYERYGQRGATVIRALADRHSASRVAVVGHGPLLCAIARKLTDNPIVQEIVLEETEGFIIRADGSVEMLKG